MTDVNDYLAHHGILGMHWGVRKPEEPRQPYEAPMGKTYQSPMNTPREIQIARNRHNVSVGAMTIAGFAFSAALVHTTIRGARADKAAGVGVDYFDKLIRKGFGRRLLKAGAIKIIGGV